MFRIRRAARPVTPLALALLAAALSPCAAAPQTDAPRGRPQGPAAGPVIKLPRGAGAEAEQPPQAETARRETHSAPRRWEYCAVTGFVRKPKGLNSSAPSAVIRYFPSESEEVEGASEDDALARAFAKLGEEGWELAGIRQSLDLREGDGKSTHVFYFKRPGRDD